MRHSGSEGCGKIAQAAQAIHQNRIVIVPPCAHFIECRSERLS